MEQISKEHEVLESDAFRIYRYSQPSKMLGYCGILQNSLTLALPETSSKLLITAD